MLKMVDIQFRCKACGKIMILMLLVLKSIIMNQTEMLTIYFLSNSHTIYLREKL